MCLSDSHPAGLDKNEWLSVLKLATMWGYQGLRKRSVEKLDELKLDNIERLLMGRQFHVSAWLVKSYEALARRDETLTEEEGGLVGVSTVCQLAKLRELSWHFACVATPHMTIISGRDCFDFTSEIHNMLENELKEDEDYEVSSPTVAGRQSSNM